MDSPSPDIDDEEDEVSDQTEAAQNLHGEEVSAGDHPKMGLDESMPARATTALGRGLEAVLQQDALHGIARNFMAEVVQRAAQARIPPARILSGHANDESGDVRLGAWPSRPALAGAVVLGCDQIAVPPQQRIRRHDGIERTKTPPANGLGLLGETATLRVCPPDPLLSELFTKRPILSLEIFDRCLLVAIDPAGNHGYKKPQVEVHERQCRTVSHHEEAGRFRLDRLFAPYAGQKSGQKSDKWRIRGGCARIGIERGDRVTLK